MRGLRRAVAWIAVGVVVTTPAAVGWRSGGTPSPATSERVSGEKAGALSERLARAVLATDETQHEASRDERGGPVLRGNPRWWIGLVPALGECSPAEAALEAALARLAVEAQEGEILVFLPASVTPSHPIRERLRNVRVIAVSDEEYVQWSRTWPLPRLAVLSQGHTPLLEVSVPRGWADGAQLLDLLAAFRRWANEGE